MSRLLMYGIKQQRRSVFSDSYVVFALQKLVLNYGGYCIKVRRSSDNTTQDIGFTSGGALDTSALLSFCGGGNGFIHTWYDQKSINDAMQTSNENQFQIVETGAVITENGYPAAKSYSPTYMSITGIDAKSIFAVGKSTATSYAYYNIVSSSTHGISLASDIKMYRQDLGGSNWAYSFYVNGSTWNVYAQGLHIVSAFRDTDLKSINTLSHNGNYWNGTILAVLIYTSDQSADRVSIEDSLANKYSLYLLSKVSVPSWGTPLNIALVGDTIVDTSGTSILAYSTGQTGAALSVNGVTFTKSTSAWGSAYSTTGVYTRGGIGVDFESMMDSFGYGGTSAVFLISGLIQGKNYLLQIFTSDDRFTNRTQYFTIESYSCDSFYQHQKGSVILNFQAYNTILKLLITAVGATIVNGYQLRQLD